jgi:hypothetical protein
MAVLEREIIILIFVALGWAYVQLFFLGSLVTQWFLLAGSAWALCLLA